MWLLLTGLVGPSSDGRYGFGGTHQARQGNDQGGGSWWMGYDFGRPRRAARPDRRGVAPPERRRGWLL